MKKEKILDALKSKGALGILTLGLVGAAAFATYQTSYGGKTDTAKSSETETEGQGLAASGQDIVAQIDLVKDYTSANELDVDPAALTAEEASADTDASETEKETDEETEAAADASSTAVIQATVSFQEDSSLIWPAAGVVLMDYDMDNTVYFETLDQYKYNPAVIIKSTAGNPVLAAAKGIVESITVTEETGTTLKLNIGNNYELTYGQLKEVAVSEGDVVEQGQLLAYVSEPTKYYCEEGSNLYFQMEKDGQTIDPMLYLNEV